MPSIKAVPMYGSSGWLIGEDGVIYNPANGNTPFNPWLQKMTLNTIIETPYLDTVTKIPYGQRYVWSFYGRSGIPFQLRRETDVLALSEIIFKPVLDRFGMDELVVCGDIFKFVGQSSYRRGVIPYFLYINSTGALIQLHGGTSSLIIEPVSWRYVNGYPCPTCLDFSHETIHTMVAKAFGKAPLPGSIIHHKDECHWNPAIENLERVDKSEHRSIHNALNLKKSGDPASKLTRNQVIHVCEQLEKDVPMKDIAEDLNPDPHIQGILLRVVSDILKGSKYRDISKDYNFTGYHKNRGPIRESDAPMVEIACQMLADSKPYSDLQIQRATNLSPHIIARIRNGNTEYNPTLHRIASKYKIDSKAYDVPAFARALDADQARKVKQYCEKSNLNDGEIASIMGCSSETVRSIRHCDSKAYIDACGDQPCVCPFSMIERKYKSEVIFLDSDLEQEYYHLKGR